MTYTINIEATFAFDMEADDIQTARAKAYTLLRTCGPIDLRCMIDKFNDPYVGLLAEEKNYDMYVTSADGKEELHEE